MFKAVLFKKRVQPKAGKPFDKVITTMTRKDGTKVYMDVKFRDCEAPSTYPVIIDFDKSRANISKHTVTGRDGNQYTYHTLWLTGYTVDPEAYVDKSLDDFE